MKTQSPWGLFSPCLLWQHAMDRLATGHHRPKAEQTFMTTLHPKTFPVLSIQLQQEIGLKSHSWASLRSDLPVLIKLPLLLRGPVPQEQRPMALSAASAPHPDLAHRLLFPPRPGSCRVKPTAYTPEGFLVLFYHFPLSKRNTRNCCSLAFLICKAPSPLQSRVKRCPAASPTNMFLLITIQAKPATASEFLLSLSLRSSFL